MPDYVKTNNAKVAAITNRVQNSVEEFRKLKASQQKMYEKYVKLMQDAEAAIKARDAAFLESETSKEHHDKDDKSSFMNRSLNKVKVGI
jgi:chromosome condensin MukBEF ATPase and DNA-binding subunit MukB